MVEYQLAPGQLEGIPVANNLDLLAVHRHGVVINDPAYRNPKTSHTSAARICQVTSQEEGKQNAFNRSSRERQGIAYLMSASKVPRVESYLSR